MISANFKQKKKFRPPWLIDRNKFLFQMGEYAYPQGLEKDE